MKQPLTSRSFAIAAGSAVYPTTQPRARSSPERTAFPPIPDGFHQVPHRSIVHCLLEGRIRNHTNIRDTWLGRLAWAASLATEGSMHYSSPCVYDRHLHSHVRHHIDFPRYFTFSCAVHAHRFGDQHRACRATLQISLASHKELKLAARRSIGSLEARPSTAILGALPSEETGFGNASDRSQAERFSGLPTHRARRASFQVCLPSCALHRSP